MPNHPPNSRSDIATGVDLQRQGNLEGALEIYRAILSSDPSNADALNLAGTVAYQCGDYSLAEQLISRAIEVFPDTPDYHNNLGRVAERQGRTALAVEHYSKALQAGPEHAAAIENLSRLTQHREESAASQEYPPNVVRQMDAALKRHQKGDFEGANAIYSGLLQVVTRNAHLFCVAAGAAQRVGRNDIALQRIQRAIALAPHVAKYRIDLGLILSEQASFDKAIESFLVASRLEPSESRPVALAQALVQTLGARRYLRSGVDVAEFFQRLLNANVECVVLRWFEKLPVLPPGEDIDLLVRDEHIPHVESLLTRDPGGHAQAIDVYSVSGLAGNNYVGLPYFPPEFSDEIIKSREWILGLYPIPSPVHHFWSMAYHAVYHKAERSGLAFDRQGGVTCAEHDYSAILGAMGESLGLSFAPTLESMHKLLGRHGRAPELGMLRKLAARSDWLKKISQRPLPDEYNGQICVFVVREWASERMLSEKIRENLEDNGLVVIKEVSLSREQKGRVSQRVRGGNWGSGPWPKSGGGPAELLACYSPHPTHPEETVQQRHPFLTDSRVQSLKTGIRDEINRSLRPNERVNPLHSSDDDAEAREFLQAVDEQLLRECVTRAVAIDRKYHTPGPAVLVQSMNRRGKVEIVSQESVKVVKKTFLPGRERYLEREVFAFGTLSKEVAGIPKLLDGGSNYLMIPFCESELPQSRNSIATREYISLLQNHLEQVVRFLWELYQRGYAMIDSNPWNFLVSESGSLNVVDFEFLYRYKRRPQTFAESYDVVGVPDDFDGDLPCGYSELPPTLYGTWCNWGICGEELASVISQFST